MADLLNTMASKRVMKRRKRRLKLPTFRGQFQTGTMILGDLCHGTQGTHQSFLDRIARTAEHDRDRPGRLFHGLGRVGTTDDNDIEIEWHHFCDRVAQPFGLPFPPSLAAKRDAQ